MKNYIITIILSTYNDKSLRNCLYSLSFQTIKNFRIILINDGGYNIKKTLEEFKTLKIDLVNLKQNIGLTKCLNICIRKVDTKYIARIDTDDYALPNRLEMQLDYLKRNKLDLIGSSTYRKSKNSDKYRISNQINSLEQLKRKMKYFAPIAHPTLFGKTNIFKNLMYNEKLIYGQDYDFIARAILNNYKIGNLNQPLLIYNTNITLDYQKIITQMRIANLVAREYTYSLKNNSSYREIDIQQFGISIYDKFCLYIRNKSSKSNWIIGKSILFVIYFIFSLFSKTQRDFNIRTLLGKISL